MNYGQGQVAKLLIWWAFALFSERRAAILPPPWDGKIEGCGKRRFRYNAFSSLAAWLSGSIR
jgi:hypothetical protein